MKRIGLLSDTHGFIHPKVTKFFENCDEIWHAGDIGNILTADRLNNIKPLKAVYGNIDDHIVRQSYPEKLIFDCESIRVFMMHIGGYPGRYTPEARKVIESEKPALFICGHSHILKIQYDNKYSLLHINPGAAGNSGWHKVITLVRFIIDKDQIKNLEIFEADRKQQTDGLEIFNENHPR